MLKQEVVNRIVMRLKDVIRIEQNKKNYEKALKTVEICASLLYQVNQRYTDKTLENAIGEIQKHILLNSSNKNSKYIKSDAILFYDGFGNNSRSLGQIYIKALCELKAEYNIGQIIYVVYKSRKNEIPDIINILKSANAEICYIDEASPGTGSIVKQIIQLNKIVIKHKPKAMFFYTQPNDVAGAAVFRHYDGKIKRFQINLTDHAFWLGKDSIDICIEFRDYGVSVSKYYRGISESKLVKLPFYPIIDYKQEFLGFPFPFDASRQKLVFSGGYLYKTLGDNNKYYKIVNHLLETYPDVVFWYAGSGDHTEMDKLIMKFPNRVYLTKERQDLFQLLGHCNFYLSTYPICGGLMFQYAAKAGKVPVTLKYGPETEGCLINQSGLGIEFTDMADLYKEMDTLLLDEKYAETKGEEMKSAVLSPKQFKEELQKVICEGNTSYRIYPEKINTNRFRHEYLKQYTKWDLYQMLVRRRGFFLFRYLPFEMISGFIRKLPRKIRE